MKCIRVYDKVAGWRREYAARKRSAGESAVPDSEACEGIERWLAAGWDIQRTRAFLNRHGHRNAGRVLNKYARFLPAGAGLTAARLFEIYQRSVGQQLRAA